MLKCVLKYNTHVRQIVSVFVHECPLLDKSFLIIAASTTKMPQYARNLIGNFFIILLFSLGYKELKVEREYRV